MSEHKNLNKKRFYAYVLGFALSVVILSLFAQVIVWLGMLLHKNFYLLTVSTIAGTFVGLLGITRLVSRYFMTTPHPISIGVTNIPNIIYDPEFERNFKIADGEILQENEHLRKRNTDLEDTLEQHVQEVYKYQDELDTLGNLVVTYVRHHKNSSRLIRSLTQLIKESKNEWRIEFCNNVLDECVTTLKKDRADKSASIFFIENDELSMFSYYRIDFDSSRGRKFKKGDGFAGDIWESMQFKTIEDVSQHESFANDLSPHHHYQSIIGCPIQIGTEVYGVLCIQSEQKNGFDKEDEIPIKFYADICALAYFCDKILIRGDEK